MHSLSRRLLLSVSVSLVVFFGVTIFVLDASFRDVSQRSLEDLLDAQIVALVAASDPQPNGVFAPAQRDLGSRLATPRSGLYAQIRPANPAVPTWRSPSNAGIDIDFGPLLHTGARSFEYTRVHGEDLAIASRGITFEDEARIRHNLTISVAASLTPYQEQLWSFRRQLFGWFVGLAILLLATLGVLLRWVLAPVRRLEREIHAVEEGSLQTLGGGYPRELSGVASNLNTLLIGERNRMTRYRNTLGNLAHSLKTPLAVMRSTLPDVSSENAQVLVREIDRMSAIVDRQLQRAASGGALLGQAPLDVAPIVDELRLAMLKVYGNRKDMVLSVDVKPGSQFVGDRDDLIELLGNLLDNASKWCKERVHIAVAPDPSAPPRERLRIVVDDDGPGIAEDDTSRVLERGVRADEQVPGHGLGLAMVRDTVELYGGSLKIERSELGGARISLALPGR
ncbi:MAG TPA: ATP-binding protein [Steroidobacteraceae bacterium]|nr:ATP-binding protein [Steroidobacteraceae bacterium]